MLNPHTRRTIFRNCGSGRHRRCPGVITSEVYKMDPLLGKIPEGKHTRVYCECPCHAHLGKPPRKAPR